MSTFKNSSQFFHFLWPPVLSQVWGCLKIFFSLQISWFKILIRLFKFWFLVCHSLSILLPYIVLSGQYIHFCDLLIAVITKMLTRAHQSMTEILILCTFLCAYLILIYCQVPGANSYGWGIDPHRCTLNPFYEFVTNKSGVNIAWKSQIASVQHWSLWIISHFKRNIL